MENKPTPVESLIKRLQSLHREIPTNNAHNRAVKGAYVHTITIAKEYLKIEQERLNAIRNAFADYYASEGCSCCQNVEEHKKAQERLGELLNVEPYEDGSGHNFYKYKTV